MGVAGLLVQVAGALVALLVGALGLLYVTDAAVDAQVEGKSCGGLGGNTVDVRTALFGLEHTVAGVGDLECGLLAPGNFVEYHVRSHRSVVYEEEGGACIWDSARGPC